MPIYEYRCSACDHKLESLQRLSDPPLKTCPQCGKETLTKMVTAAGFQLKGSGWYATDFKNSGSKPVAKENGKGEKDATAPASTDAASSSDASTPKVESKTESKPAETKPATPTTPSAT